ncbi:Ribonuclease H-like domain containing protein [Parasponia andersonii]|uniref:Ribonuclease H-like domain containing protein n=1 Tax=Parasponia andersonii TaxID=3476 RepID=A0A2P5ASS7_PARAD|nr:Ribonuclease H-like domain containing protein [Parasponia andersonii]
MLRACVLDFHGFWSKYLPLIEFTYNNSYQASIEMPPYEALYGRKCRSLIHWDKMGEKKFLGPKLVKETAEAVEKIRKRLLAIQNKKKHYADPRRREVIFDIGDKVFLKVAPMKGIMRFGMKGKLSPRYIGPFEILDKVGDVVYRLALPPLLSNVHNVFSRLYVKKICSKPFTYFKLRAIRVEPDVSYEEELVEILDRKDKELRNKKILLVKVL